MYGIEKLRSKMPGLFVTHRALDARTCADDMSKKRLEKVSILHLSTMKHDENPSERKSAFMAGIILAILFKGYVLEAGILREKEKCFV